VEDNPNPEGIAVTKDEILEMADKADEEADNVLNMKGEYHPNWHQVRDEAFAKLVAEREREACAKLIESHGQTLANGFMLTEAIRARGQA